MAGFWRGLASALGSREGNTFVWVRIEENPHAGCALISDSIKNPFDSAIRINDVNMDWAKANVIGKVLSDKVKPGDQFDPQSFMGAIR